MKNLKKIEKKANELYEYFSDKVSNTYGYNVIDAMVEIDTMRSCNSGAQLSAIELVAKKWSKMLNFGK